MNWELGGLWEFVGLGVRVLGSGRATGGKFPVAGVLSSIIYGLHDLRSELLVSPLTSLIVLSYIIPYITAFKELNIGLRKMISKVYEGASLGNSPAAAVLSKIMVPYGVRFAICHS